VDRGVVVRPAHLTANGGRSDDESTDRVVFARWYERQVDRFGAPAAGDPGLGRQRPAVLNQLHLHHLVGYAGRLQFGGHRASVVADDLDGGFGADDSQVTPAFPLRADRHRIDRHVGVGRGLTRVAVAGLDSVGQDQHRGRVARGGGLRRPLDRPGQIGGAGVGPPGRQRRQHLQILSRDRLPREVGKVHVEGCIEAIDLTAQGRNRLGMPIRRAVMVYGGHGGRPVDQHPHGRSRAAPGRRNRHRRLEQQRQHNRDGRHPKQKQRDKAFGRQMIQRRQVVHGDRHDDPPHRRHSRGRSRGRLKGPSGDAGADQRDQAGDRPPRGRPSGEKQAEQAHRPTGRGQGEQSRPTPSVQQTPCSRRQQDRGQDGGNRRGDPAAFEQQIDPIGPHLKHRIQRWMTCVDYAGSSVWPPAQVRSVTRAAEAMELFGRKATR